MCAAIPTRATLRPEPGRLRCRRVGAGSSLVLARGGARRRCCRGGRRSVQVAAQSVQAVGGVAGVGQQRWRQRAGVGGASCDRRTAASRQVPRYDHHLGGGEPVHDPQSRTRAADASIAVWDAPDAETPKRAFLHAAPLSPAPGGNSTAHAEQRRRRILEHDARGFLLIWSLSEDPRS
jgi:hypothetical protein